MKSSPIRGPSRKTKVRTLISALIAAFALGACGQGQATNTSSVQGATDTLTWHVTYRGATDSGPVSFTPGNMTQIIMLHNMPTGQSEDLVITVSNATQVLYSGTIAGFIASSGSTTLYKMPLSDVSPTPTSGSAPQGAGGVAVASGPKFVTVPSADGQGTATVSAGGGFFGNIVVELIAPPASSGD